MPFAAASGVCAGFRRSSVDAGNTEISAPVSAKYDRPLLSQTVNVRPLSFPFTVLMAKGLNGRKRGEIVGDAVEDGMVRVGVEVPAVSTDRRGRFPDPSVPGAISRRSILACTCMPAYRTFCVRNTRNSRRSSPLQRLLVGLLGLCLPCP